MDRTSIKKADALVPGIGTILCSMQGGENWSVILRGTFHPWVQRCQVVIAKCMQWLTCAESQGQKLA